MGAIAASFLASIDFKKVTRYLMHRVRRREDVDDLAQEVWLRLLKVSDDVIVEKPLAYVYGIASHVLADHMFSLKHDRIDWSEDVDERMDAPACILPDDLADRLNLQQQIDAALAQLPPTHAAVLLLHKRDGLSYEEVAEKLGLSFHTVAKYVTVSKTMLRTMSWDRGQC